MLERKKLPLPWLILHWLIIVHFVMEIAYSGYMVFLVLRPEGISGPLGQAAVQLIKDNPNLMMVRRAYATENWIATGGLAVYLAITELAPRMWGRRDAEKAD